MQVPAGISQVADLTQTVETIREAIAWIEGIDPGAFDDELIEKKEPAAAAVTVCPLKEARRTVLQRKSLSGTNGPGL